MGSAPGNGAGWQAPGRLSHGRGANISHAAEHNRHLILHEIRASSGVDRTSLAKITGLTAPAVFKIVTDLVDEGLIVSTRIREGARGQPRSVLTINPHAAYSLGLNVDRDRLCLVALDYAGVVRVRLHQEANMASPEDARNFVDRCIGTIRAKQLFPLHKVVAVGLSMPDDYLRVGGREIQASWSDADWAEAFRALNHLPIVRENDAAAASIGEMKFGAGLKAPTFFYVYISVGLGGGLVVNRQYIRGRHGRSGELGYIPQVNPFRQRKTSLGKTVEEVVSLRGLTQTLGLDDKGADITTGLNNAWERGDPRLADWIEEASELLYLPLLSVLCTMDPDAIFVGGRLPAPLIDRLCLNVSRRLSLNVGIHWPEMIVRPGRLAEDTAAVGAAILALSSMWDPRENDPPPVGTIERLTANTGSLVDSKRRSGPLFCRAV